MRIRPPQVAGYFYPANRDELIKTIRFFLEKAEDLQFGKIRSLISPHAGYVYCGEVAAWGYKQIESLDYRKVIILASNHSYAAYVGASVPKFDFYETPLGKVKVSPLVKNLLKVKPFLSVKEAHMTHVVEVQLPFLQTVLEDFEIVPIVLSMTGEEEQKMLAEILENHLDEKTLIIVSSDLSHYYAYDKATQLDKSCLKAIEKQDVQLVKTQQACGLEAILVTLMLARKLGWKSKVILYKNSGDTTGSKSEVVGYGSVAFY